MSLSRQVKANGCPSIAALGRWLGMPDHQLYRWYARNDQITYALSLGYAAHHERETIRDAINKALGNA